jgi:cell division protein FtsZ
VLYSGVRGITDLMVMPGLINLDFADVRTVMAGMGTAMMGTGEGAGENRALKAAQSAIANPLLDDVSMKGAKGVLINITGGYDMTLFEVDEAANEVRREIDADAHIILGSTFDEAMSGKIRVSVVAAGVQVTPAARPAPQPVREPPVREMQSGLSAAVLNSPSPAAELGLSHTQSEAVQPAPQAARQQPTPIIRRPAPAPVPEEPEQAANDVAPEPAPEPQGKSFASLFGWKSKPASEPVAPAPKPPEGEDTFDDELEIPAFLRRSANT